MLDLLIKSKVRLKMLGFFVLNADRDFYARQVAIEIGESPHAVGLELNYLTKGSLLTKVVRDGQTRYRLNEDNPFSPILKKTIEKMYALKNEEMISIPNISQRERIKNNLERMVEDIKKYYEPEKIILYGSAASGKIGPHSDIDLIIVRKTELPFFKRAQQLVDLLDYDVDVDFLVYTPEEFEKAVRTNPFFDREILKKGKVVYAKAA